MATSTRQNTPAEPDDAVATRLCTARSYGRNGAVSATLLQDACDILNIDSDTPLRIHIFQDHIEITRRNTDHTPSQTDSVLTTRDRDPVEQHNSLVVGIPRIAKDALDLDPGDPLMCSIHPDRVEYYPAGKYLNLGGDDDRRR